MTLSATSLPSPIQHPVREPPDPRALSQKQAWADRSWRDASAQMDVEKGTAGGYGHAAREDLEFSDLIDLVNPLQHIPGVAQVYRAITGDTIKPVVKVAGSLLLGGPMGLIAGAGVAVLEAAMGGEPLTQVAAALGAGGGAGNSTAATGTATVAAAMPAPSAPNAAAMRAEAQLAHVGDGTTRGDSPAGQSNPAQGAPMEISSAADAVLSALAGGASGGVPAGATGAARGSAVADGAASRGPAAPDLPRMNLAHLAAAEAGRSGGKGIRDYFAEAVPRAVRAPVKPAEPAAVQAPPSSAVSGTPPTAAPVRSEVKQTGEKREPALGTNAALPNKAAPVQQQVPPWFADRVLDALERYQSGAKENAAGAPAQG